jgi:hypothetical protein
MKCVKCYKVDCPRGWYQVARAVNGRYFFREWGFNGFGVGFSKWEPLGRLVKIESRDSKYDCMVIFENSRLVVSLRRVSDGVGIRLPN